MRNLLSALIALGLVGCGDVKDSSSLARPVALNQPTTVGVGDTVLDLRLRQSLPNAFGRADVFGRTKDAGRVVVKYLGSKDGRAYFVRNDLTIESNETTMSRSGFFVPTTSTTYAAGNVGTVPVSGTAVTTGSTYVPPAPVTGYIASSGGIPISAPVGGSIPVEGRTIRVLKVEGESVTYSVQ